MDASVKHRFQMGRFSVDTRNRTLHRDGTPIDLRPKSFDVLAYLVENAGILVGKDELIEMVWPNVIATDESLARCISDIRAAIGDQNRTVIKTVPGRGYVLTVGVAPLLANPPRASIGPVPNALSGRMRKGVVVALVGLLVLVSLYAFMPSREKTFGDRPSIAILPFTQAGSDDVDYVGLGLAQDISGALSQFSELFVIADMSASAENLRDKSTRVIGQRLGARYLVLGRIENGPETLSVSVRLLDAERETQLWGARFVQPLNGQVSISGDIVSAIAVQLLGRIERSRLDELQARRTATWTAYDHTLRGDAIMRRAPKDRTGEVVLAARAAYGEALSVTPGHPPALVGLALNIWTGWLKPLPAPKISGDFQNPAALNEAERLLRAAIDADSHHAEAWAALGWIQYWKYGPKHGIDAFETAFSLNPNLSDGRYALLLAHAGDPKGALAAIETAMRQNPLYPLRYKYYQGLALYLSGDAKRAKPLLTEVAENLAGFPTGYPVLAAVAVAAEDETLAQHAAAKTIAMRPDFSVARFLAFMQFDDDGAERRLEQDLRAAGLPE